MIILALVLYVLGAVDAYETTWIIGVLSKDVEPRRRTLRVSAVLWPLYALISANDAWITVRKR